MSELLDTNAHGRRVLTLQKARALARDGFAGTWYIAPYDTRWTVGLLSAEDRRPYHVLDEQGEPLRFELEWDAWEYLRQELKIPRWKLPPSPRRQLGPSIAMFPSLAHVLFDRRARPVPHSGEGRK
jgi:hypothetical protein